MHIVPRHREGTSYRHRADLTAVDRATQVAEAQVEGINRLTPPFRRARIQHSVYQGSVTAKHTREEPHP